MRIGGGGVRRTVTNPVSSLWLCAFRVFYNGLITTNHQTLSFKSDYFRGFLSKYYDRALWFVCVCVCLGYP